MDSGILKGLLIGFSIAAPVGPIGVLCIRRTLAHGRLSGLASGLGAATADATYGCIAGFGLTVVSTFLIDQQSILRLVGGLYLVYLGLSTVRSKPAETAVSEKGKGIFGDYLSTFLLTITNPLTIISFAAVFAGLGIAGSGGDYPAAAQLVSGVFLGSALWWLLLSGGVGFFRRSFDTQRLRWVNALSCVVILGFGAIAIASLVGGRL
jgi:threonine/homoserine/homoserine lactone efflux protein